MTKFTAFLLLTASFFLSFQAKSQSFTEEAFRFQILDGKMTLDGVLSIPKSGDKEMPLVIFVAPPQGNNRNYGGFFKALSDSLAKNGIATYRYDNRNYSDSTRHPRHSDTFSVFDIANDAHDAIVALQKDARFSTSPIGLIGHSEGGNATAIETSRNPDVNFLIVLSTVGIPGSQLAYTQMSAQTDDFTEMMSNSDRNKLKKLQYKSIKIIESNTDDEKIRSLFLDEMKKLKESYDRQENSSSSGKQSEDVITDMLLSSFMQPRMREYIRYKPELYYSKIKSPILAVWGKRDEKIMGKQNLDGLEQIFIENHKQNYIMVTIDGVNHAYEETECMDFPEYVSPHPKKREWTPGAGFSKLSSIVVAWIKENK